MSDVWVVLVHIDGQPAPDIYGPYTEMQAGRVCDQLLAEVGISTTPSGERVHPLRVAGAEAIRLVRYQEFMTREDRRAAQQHVMELAP